LRLVLICCCVLLCLVVVPAVCALEPTKAGLATCPVGSLSEISDPKALAFEEGTKPPEQHVEGLTRRTLAALARLKHFVVSLGGVFTLRSAYRPATYQAHLQEVWDKWMRELRTNRDPECQALRASVQQEFERHSLIETQRPVDASDHTLGIAFDAEVALPAQARLRRRRVTVDLLARLSGLLRPDLFHDPVHFRLASTRAVPATTVTSRNRRSRRAGLHASRSSSRSRRLSRT
jgi:hypothetical protein